MYSSFGIVLASCVLWHFSIVKGFRVVYDKSRELQSSLCEKSVSVSWVKTGNGQGDVFGALKSCCGGL